MTTQQIEAYSYYKKLYPEAILLFHYEKTYVALLDDADKVAHILHQSITQKWVSIPDDDLNLISRISEVFENIRMIDYRNLDGIYDFPDVQALQEAKLSDY